MTWKTGIIVLGVAVLLSFGGGFWCGWSVKRCDPKYIVTESVSYDTVYVNDPKTEIAYSKPKPRKLNNGTAVKLSDIKVKQAIVSDTSGNSNIKDICENNLFFYSDTIRKENSYTAVINDTVNGSVLGRSFEFTDLRPEIIRYETTTVNVPVERKHPLLKVYLGVFGGTKFQGETGLAGASFGGDLTTVWNDRFMVRGSVDGLQRSAHLGFGVKLSLRK